MESAEDRIRRVSSERITIVPYDPTWPARFEAEKARLLALLPPGLMLRVEHVGSTAIPGLAAKPIVDILVGVADVTEARVVAVPALERKGYEYFWRPLIGDDGPPWYPWFIKRDCDGTRTHHVHVLDIRWPEFLDWVLFRDSLRSQPAAAARYAGLKQHLADEFPFDRTAYTEAKTAFITEVVRRARERLSQAGGGDPKG